jgi:hypothetical protein
MRFFQNDSEITSLFKEIYSKEYLELISSYLETKDIEISYDIFKEDPKYNDEEMWELPINFKPWFQSSDVVLKRNNKMDLAVGFFAMGHYYDKKVIIEQNASPIQVYWNKKC